VSRVARSLGRSVSSVTREIRRNRRDDAKTAQALTGARLVDSRSGIDTTSERFEAMMETAKPLIKDNGQVGRACLLRPQA